MKHDSEWKLLTKSPVPPVCPGCILLLVMGPVTLSSPGDSLACHPSDSSLRSFPHTTTPAGAELAKLLRGLGNPCPLVSLAPLQTQVPTLPPHRGCHCSSALWVCPEPWSHL